LTCSTARELMLEADPLDLLGATQTELSLHVDGCTRCRTAAQRMLEVERELRDALGAATPRRSVNDAVRVARRRAWRRSWLWRASPLAAAAVLAIVWLGRRAPLQQPASPPIRPAGGSSVAVAAPPGKSVAVFRTDNPDIVVIWFF